MSTQLTYGPALNAELRYRHELVAQAAGRTGLLRRLRTRRGR